MKAVISRGGKSLQKEIDPKMVYGKKIGDKINGNLVELENYELQITGGSDKQGFPMKKGVSGSMRKRLLLSEGVGYKPKTRGVRRRKSIRGEIVSEETEQLNLKVVKESAKKFEEFFKKEEPVGEGKDGEEKKEDKPEEKKNK
ncbi:MAG: 30S ribosomal protein S6e [Candidatus Aenigmatarchaeota archaeon]|nr:MAG: 30S ribosomal protein S6e [Candidatus Aenigmarchaeota archaeon]